MLSSTGSMWAGIILFLFQKWLQNELNNDLDVHSTAQWSLQTPKIVWVVTYSGPGFEPVCGSCLDILRKILLLKSVSCAHKQASLAWRQHLFSLLNITDIRSPRWHLLETSRNAVCCYDCTASLARSMHICSPATSK